MKTKIVIIGVGNMGGAIARALTKTLGKENLFLCDRGDNPNKAIASADIVILAVKPQSFDELANSINMKLNGKLIISIMAGVTIKKISEKLGAKKIIRSMPNLGIQVKTGVIGWIASPKVTKEERRKVHGLFSTMGQSIEVKKESLLNAITALSGSGPAYFFYLTELLEEKAKSFGFSTNEARIIAETTLIGSSKLLEVGKKNAAEWRTAVTSKKGTTEAALSHLKTHHFDQIFLDAIEAAKKRSEELNQ
ncbi:MAG: pyrroline-5-carboxylate reductase [Candidatus Peregrinibacteria bacterium]